MYYNTYTTNQVTSSNETKHLAQLLSSSHAHRCAAHSWTLLFHTTTYVRTGMRLTGTSVSVTTSH